MYKTFYEKCTVFEDKCLQRLSRLKSRCNLFEVYYEIWACFCVERTIINAEVTWFELIFKVLFVVRNCHFRFAALSCSGEEA